MDFRNFTSSPPLSRCSEIRPNLANTTDFKKKEFNVEIVN